MEKERRLAASPDILVMHKPIVEMKCTHRNTTSIPIAVVRILQVSYHFACEKHVIQDDSFTTLFVVRPLWLLQRQNEAERAAVAHLAAHPHFAAM